MKSDQFFSKLTKALYEGISQEDLADVLYNALERRKPDVVTKYGHEVVGNVILDVASFYQGLDELGTSDISIMLRTVIKQLEEYNKETDLTEVSQETLSSYKKKAGIEASRLDKEAFSNVNDPESKEKIEKANKRFRGILRATQKQLDKDVKKEVEEGQIYFQGGGGSESQRWYEPRKVPNQNDLDQLDELKCWPGYTRVQGVPAGKPGSCKKKTKESSIIKGLQTETNQELEENLRKWFDEKWVRFGPDGKIRGACARGDDSEGKPKCLPQKKAHSLGKKGRKYAASKKRREDPNPERSGKAINVATKKKSNEGVTEEKCPHCNGPMFSELLINEKKDACYYKVKSRYKVWPSAYASGALVKCRKKGASNWGTGGKKSESVLEGQDSIVDKCASLAAKYFNDAGLQREYDIDEFIKINAGDNVAVDKCASLAAKYFNDAGLQREYDIDEYIKVHALQGVAEAKPSGESTHWRVEQSEATGRYHVITGYQKRKIWSNKLGAIDFVSKDAAQKKADELNQKENVTEGFKNTYNVGDRVNTPIGPGVVTMISNNINIDGKVKVKLDDPSRAGEDGKYKDEFVFTTNMLKHLPDQGVAESKQPGKSVTDAIQKVLPIAQEIWFHGSHATGSHRRNSDTDILVVIPDDLVGDQYLAVVRILQKLASHFDNYDIQPTKSGTNIHRIAQEEGRLLWSSKQGVAEGNDQEFHTGGSKGLPFPGTYEQENNMFKTKGPRRITAMTYESQLDEKWSDKYKRSIDCNNPKGFSQKAHCQGRKKNESMYKNQNMGNILEGIQTTQLLKETLTYKLWESAGHKIMEAQLTADQINQLFTNVEQSATAAGSNRTMLGKGKDAASAVNKAWEELKTKAQNSGPIKNVDAMYDQAAEKLKQATGGDQGVMKYVQMYRDFAKEHPVAQSLIYSALIAAAGISGAGLGGAAALGLFKMVDKLLQGEKFSSAAYSGAKTGAMAYGASKVGDLIRGQDAGVAGDAAGSAASAAENPSVQRLSNWAAKNYDPSRFDYVPKGSTVYIYDKAGQLVQTISTDQQLSRAGIYTGQQALEIMKKAAKVSESVQVSKAQMKILVEGILDTIKGAAQQMGKNLTTKVTADKLMSAWKKAGSPTDSAQISALLIQNGVSQDIVNGVFAKMKIPTTPTQPQQQASQQTTPQRSPASTFAQPQAATAQAKQAAPATTAAGGTGSTPVLVKIQRAFATLNPAEKASLLQTLQKDISTQSSTGGTITSTPTGVIHRSKKTPAKPKKAGAGAFAAMASQLGGTT